MFASFMRAHMGVSRVVVHSLRGRQMATSDRTSSWGGRMVLKLRTALC